MKNIQAFPIKEAIQLVDTFGKETVIVQQGMTLLDWFAGQSLAGIKANHQLLKILQDYLATDDKSTQEIIADMAYTDAEAMLKEREKRNKD